eukprot:SAG22_NODE_1549_length_4150_cov_2.766477_2_plen_795_part_00
MEFSHKPGPSHQQNKARKARHDSKRAIKGKSFGRVDGGGGHRATAKAGFNVGESKLQRKNAVKADKQARRAEMLRQRRNHQESTAPKVVGFIGLAPESDLAAAAAVLVTDSSCKFSTEAMTAGAPFHLTAGPGRPANLTLAFAPREMDAVLDLCKVADVVVLVHTAGEDLDDFTNAVLSSVRNQGAPTVVGLIQNVDALPQKMQHGVRKDFLKFVRQNFPSKDEPKSFDSAVKADRANFVRHVCGLRPREVIWRAGIPNLLCDNLHYSEADATLRVSGFLRGRSLSPDQLVHITGTGTYKLRQVEILSTPFDSKAAGGGGGPTVHVTNAARAAPVEMENEVDLMAGEQTWPTEEEMAASDAAQAAGGGGTAQGDAAPAVVTRRLPRGTSDYQSAWYAASDEEDLPGMDAGGSDDDVEDVPVAGAAAGAGGGVSAGGSSAGRGAEGPMDEDEDYDATDVEAARQERREAAAEDDAIFPDEMDTPLEGLARERFARYRGMKSFRSSPWDPKESLPQLYARIFEFRNINLAKKRILEEHDAHVEVAHPGQYVTVVLEGVTVDAVAALRARALGGDGAVCPAPIVLSGLFAHENQITVMHMLVQRAVEYEEPVRSKDPVVVHAGFRRFSSRPIYSDHNTNCDKSKLQRYMSHGFVVATVFAPACFASNCPALIFTPAGGAVAPLLHTASAVPIAVGSILSLDVNRIVLKRTVLSGFPYKIHKTRAVIRYMFFNAEDIHWFKPIELRTKFGRTGHILDSVGTRGYMKVQFDGPLRGNDTVCLNLFKRTFPPEWDVAWFG